MRILVVDDDPSVASTLKIVLRRGGYEPEVVSIATEALAAFEPGKFGLIITDYEMAGMKGSELASVVKSRSPNQKILMLTGHLEKVKELGTAAGADVVVGKPFGVKELLGSIHELVSESAERPAGPHLNESLAACESRKARPAETTEGKENVG